MADQKTDQLELKLKTLAGILKRLSLPELFKAQDLLSEIIKDKCVSEQLDKIRLMKLYDESQKLLQESRNEFAKLEDEFLRVSGRYNDLCWQTLDRRVRERSQIDE